MEDNNSNVDQESNSNGFNIIEILYRAEGLIRDELKKQLENSTSLEVRVLLEAQLNIYRAIDALYDRESYKYMT
jgi:hypothetical protein